MNCRDFEMKIYLYAELSEGERTQVDAHIETCQRCSTLFQEVKQAQELVHQVAGEKGVPRHAAQLTASIMSAITQPAKPTWYAWVNDLLRSRESNYVLSALSSVLILVFFIQSIGDSPRIRIDNNESLANSVILNAKLFRDNFSHNRAKHALFADCRSPFQSSQYYQNCVKSKLK